MDEHGSAVHCNAVHNQTTSSLIARRRLGSCTDGDTHSDTSQRDERLEGHGPDMVYLHPPTQLYQTSFLSIAVLSTSNQLVTVKYLSALSIWLKCWTAPPKC